MWLTKDKYEVVQLWETKPDYYKGCYLGTHLGHYEVGMIFHEENAPKLDVGEIIEVELKVKE